MCVATALLFAFADSTSAQPLGKVTIAKMFARPTTRIIELQLGKALSEEARKLLLLEPVSRGWQVISLQTATGETRTLEIGAVRIDPTGIGIELEVAPGTADLAEWLDTSTHAISVTCLRSAGLAQAVLTPPAAQAGTATPRAFAAAATAQLADVYFSGKITAADGSKPAFSFEARLKDDWRLAGNRGAIGYLAEVFADQQTNVDPDRIVVSATYRKVIAAQQNGLILHVQPVAGEFSRNAPRTKTVLTTAHVEHVLVPSTGTSKSVARMALVVFGGVEVGNNFSNALDKDNGSGAVFRVRTVAHPYVIFRPGKGLLKNVKASAVWDARFLANEEIDPGELDAAGKPTLTRRARQHLKADLDFGISDFVSLTVQHRWGYLPPLYKKVSPSVAVSLTFKGVWL
jgi:hypothetical protein